MTDADKTEITQTPADQPVSAPVPQPAPDSQPQPDPEPTPDPTPEPDPTPTPDTWDWTQGVEPPFRYLFPADQLPTDPPAWAAGTGHWELATLSDQGTVVSQWPAWIADPVKTAEQIAAEAARALNAEAAATRAGLDTAAMQASAAQLATVAAQLKQAAAALDVAQMTEPVNGLTLGNFTAMGTDAINATRQSIGQVATLIQQATAGLSDVATANKDLADQNHAQSTALDQIIAASQKTLESLPENAVRAAMVAESGQG